MVMMKMAAFSNAAALLLFFSVFAPADSTGCDMYGAAKANVTVPLPYNLKKSDHLRWRHDNSIILDQRPNKFVKGSLSDITENGSLILKNLDQSKEGTYTPEIYEDGKSKGNMGSIKLCILEPVSQPQVKIQCLSPSVKFTCAVDKGDNPTFEWLQNSKILANAKEPFLTKTVKAVETATFSCKVSNKVSSMTSPDVKQNCIKGSDSESLLNREIYGINIWILVGSGGGLVLVLMILVIVCCIRNKRRKHEEELRLQLASANQHHHQHQNQHHHHQQQPAGHTGPRQNRSRQQRNQQRNQQNPTPDHPNGQPQPSPRRPAQAPRPADTKEEQPPPLPQPRKKGPRAP
uniref:T-cell surface antigen CD2-like isoform X2 n=1 Tax=Scatophagus argus TaxID=75038 RepID=UPI001ED840A7|nr:T-cell surface antigen CD2-like isoform X2 [Scatophagus argus]